MGGGKGVAMTSPLKSSSSKLDSIFMCTGGGEGKHCLMPKIRSATLFCLLPLWEDACTLPPGGWEDPISFQN